VSVVDSEMASRVRELDWSSTPLGPIEQWPTALRIAVGICLNSRFPMFVWWGPQLINIYNDGYIPMLGARHPAALGRPARDSWDDIWDVVGAQARIVMEEGRATYNDRVLLVMERHGYREETWFTWSYSPILDEAGKVVGLFCAVTEETGRVLAERERDRLLAQVENERARLAEAFERAPAFVAIMRGPQHVFEYVNSAYTRLLGGRTLIALGAREAVPEVEGQGFFEILDRVYETGEPFVGRAMHIRLQRGTPSALEDLYIDFVYQPVRDERGTITGIMAHGVDVTAHKLSENRDRFLLAFEDAMRALSDPQEIVELSTRLLGEHLQVSRCAYGAVDEDAERFELLGQYLDGVPRVAGGYRFDDYEPELRARLLADEPYVIDDTSALAGARQGQYFRSRHTRAVAAVPLHKAGRLVALLTVNSAVPRAWQSVEVVLMRHVANRCWDAIQRGRAEQRLRESLEAEQSARGEAERASRMKDEFLATLSHELRTPLNAILGWSHMLRRPEVAPRDVQRGAEVIERNARAQSTIIEDLLDMSAIISGKVRLHMLPLDMAAALRTAVDTSRPTAEAKQVALTLDASGVEGAQVSCDPNRLQQVLWNLLTNAIKFTPAGGRVAVRAAQDDTGVLIEVDDTGEGISADFLPYLFDRFRQADASSTRRHGGLGLGLSIVKHLVELHGGIVTARSAGPGRGATFTVTLPVLGEESAASSQAPDERPAASRDGVHAEGWADIAGKRVLVVDDDTDARELVRRLLEECAVDVATAASAAEAFQRLQQEHFDALVSDIGMPGEDGHALLRRVRAMPDRVKAQTPALALTAYARAEDRAKAMQAGFQLHAAKPVDPAQLVALVDALVRKRAAA
jgi:signal transduction histidine kinase/CheY-like chemotaxis protein